MALSGDIVIPLKVMLKALASSLGVYRHPSCTTGGTDSARYCYSVWLRHLCIAHESGLSTAPHVVAELGPGDSIGVGLAALISGADEYYALDVVEYASAERNLLIFDELVRLFQECKAIPNDAEFPKVRPLLGSYAFPDHILTGERLAGALDRGRLAAIRRALQNVGSVREGARISYFVPWDEATVIVESSVDMVLSQAVLEHVDDLAATYAAIFRWLKPGGCMSHQIDLSSHEIAPEWNGHWAYSDFAWKIMKKNQPYLLNRQPHSAHIKLIRETGFVVLCDITRKEPEGVDKKKLARRFRRLSQEDLTTRSVFIQAVRPGESAADRTESAENRGQDAV